VDKAEPMALQKYKISLGGIIFSVISECSLGLTLPTPNRAFMVSEGSPEVILKARFGAVPSLEMEEELFKTDGVWGLYRSGDKQVLHFCAYEMESIPYKLAVMESDFTAGTIYTRSKESGNENCFDPLNYPLDEVLIVNLMSRGRGMLVHAAAVEYHGQGWLFLGTSGAGKTTLSRLWQQEPDAKLLSDDRIIIRNKGEHYYIYGTPWHGNAEIASPLSTQLKAIFFLAHDNKNRLTPVRSMDAASRMLVRTFPTFWDAKGMQYTLELSERLCTRTPCFELGFIPDMRVIELLKSQVPEAV
jgi:hypothetical protein